MDNEYFYEGYNSDFGPLTLQFVHKFIENIEAHLQRKKRVIHHCGEGFKAQANGSFLMGSFLIVSKKWTVKQV